MITDDERAKLQERLKELDDAMTGIEEARKPFDMAIVALQGVKEQLLEDHEAEIAGVACGHHEHNAPMVALMQRTGWAVDHIVRSIGATP